MKILGKRADLWGVGCEGMRVCMHACVCVLSTCVFTLVCASHILWLNYPVFGPSLLMKTCIPASLLCAALLCGLLLHASENNLGETETKFDLAWKKSFLHFFLKNDQSGHFYIRIKSQRLANPGKMWSWRLPQIWYLDKPMPKYPRLIPWLWELQHHRRSFYPIAGTSLVGSHFATEDFFSRFFLREIGFN